MLDPLIKLINTVVTEENKENLEMLLKTIESNIKQSEANTKTNYLSKDSHSLSIAGDDLRNI